MTANSKIEKGYFLWSIPFLLLFACNTAPSNSSKKADPNNSEWYVAYNAKGDVRNKNNKLDVYTVRFYPDSTYTLCAGLLFEQGNWKFDTQKKLLVLTPSIKSGELTERYIVDQTIHSQKTTFSFYHQYPLNTGDPDEIIDVQSVSNQSAYDPYSKAMNQWRAKPSQPETAAQIQQRVVAYLGFLQALYHHAKDNNLENAGGNWYPQPIQFFSNKVSMAYANELTDWYNCFYDEPQGIEGYKLISGALMKIKIDGKDDVSRNINCVEQLLKEIKK